VIFNNTDIVCELLLKFRRGRQKDRSVGLSHFGDLEHLAFPITADYHYCYFALCRASGRKIFKWEVALLPFSLIVGPVHRYFGWTAMIIKLKGELSVSDAIPAPKFRPQGNPNVLPMNAIPEGIGQETGWNRL
jgi:hypothetical protein